MKKILIWTSVVWYAYFLWSCANPVSLVGGEKDTTAPQVVKDGALPKNLQTNFQKQDIAFTFDEWVKLNDVANEVVVSPPLEKRPDIKLKNKELIFAFHPDEVLKEDVTYSINFGEGIKDLTEGNPADLKYVFSTGDLIDSLIVSGTVTDAIGGEPIENCLVMLYNNLSDTIVRTENPYYFSKTDKSGKFKIENVKEGEFKIFALHEDQGKRYVFDSETEGIGFLENSIIVNDSTGQGIALQIFKEEKELKLKDEKLEQYGHAWFAFNRDAYDLEISHEEVGQNLTYDIRKDSVHIWYDTEESFLVYFARDTFWKDTVTIKAMSRADFLKDGKLNLSNSHEGVKDVNKQDGMALLFSNPVASVDNSLIGLYADTTQALVNASMQKDTTMFGVNVISDWQTEKPYELLLLPGAVVDIYGLQNDTINLSYLMKSSEEYGEIKVKVVDLNTEENYILRLLNKSKLEIKRYNLKSLSEFEFELRYMTPGDYLVEVVLDRNKNNRWDTGNYDKGTYPEKIFTQDLETLRANWKLEVDVSPEFGQKK